MGIPRRFIVVKLSILVPVVGLLATVSVGGARAQQRPTPRTTPADRRTRATDWSVS
jgi:hypothetical protein